MRISSKKISCRQFKEKTVMRHKRGAMPQAATAVSE
jgi:hypothetical protein